MLVRILKDCLPTIISLTLLGLYGVVDGLFIGNAVGDIGLSAINIAWPIPAFIIASGVGIGIGGSVLISHARGRQDADATRRTFRVTLTLLLIVSVALSLLFFPFYPQLLQLFGASGDLLIEAKNYTFIVLCGAIFQMTAAGIVPLLRNFNLSMGAMICTGIGTVLNVLINYLLIMVLDLGIVGAALGTMISQIITCAIAFFLLFRYASISVKPLLDRTIIKGIFKVGVTAFGVSIAPSITLLVTNLQAVTYGGNPAVACYAVIAYIAFPCQSMLTGVGEGAQPLLSYHSGADDHEVVAKITRIALLLNLGFGALLTAVVLLAIPYIGGWFGLSQEAMPLFLEGMQVYALSFIVAGFAKFNLSYLNATLQTKKAMVLTYLESLVLSPLLLVLLPLLVGLQGIWLSYPATALCMLLIAGILLLKKRVFKATI